MTTTPESKPLSEIRTTHALCPECLRCFSAQVVEDEGKVWLVRHCDRHGEQRTFLSEHPDYYRDVSGYYFDVMQQRYPQRDYILRMTERCNLECPICLAGANQHVLDDFSLDELQRLLKGMRGQKIDLMGCEPTCVSVLPEMLQMIKDTGNIAALHSNGVALADFKYVQLLKDCGLDEVHLQFDGFDDEAYQVIRGEPLLENKRAAFDNLAKLSIPVDLVMTVLDGVNDKEIADVLDFGARHSNVKEVFFLGCRLLGRAAGKFENEQLLPDQVIDIVEEATDGRVGRAKVRRFQKLYFALLSVFGVRKCLYIQHYLLLRDGEDSFKTVDDIIDMERLEKILDRYRERKRRGARMAALRLLSGMLPIVVNRRSFGVLSELFALTLLMKFGFNLRRVRRRTIMLGYITACDPTIYDTSVAENCGKGEISRDLGFQECGALANVLREHRWKEQA